MTLFTRDDIECLCIPMVDYSMFLLFFKAIPGKVEISFLHRKLPGITLKNSKNMIL